MVMLALSQKQCPDLTLVIIIYSINVAFPSVFSSISGVRSNLEAILKKRIVFKMVSAVIQAGRTVAPLCKVVNRTQPAAMVWKCLFQLKYIAFQFAIFFLRL